jgi:hypothetical protein
LGSLGRHRCRVGVARAAASPDQHFYQLTPSDGPNVDRGDAFSAKQNRLQGFLRKDLDAGGARSRIRSYRNFRPLPAASTSLPEHAVALVFPGAGEHVADCTLSAARHLDALRSSRGCVLTTMCFWRARHTIC